MGRPRQISVLLISFALQPVLLQYEMTACNTHSFFANGSSTGVDAVPSGRSAEGSQGLGCLTQAPGLPSWF